MNKQLVTQPEITLVGLTVRTNNQNEMDQKKSKIGALVHRYLQEDCASYIPNRKHPGLTYAAYTDYDSNEFGDYTYFMGEVVASDDDVPNGYRKLIIPAGKYQKFSLAPGKFPDVVISAWQKIWQMTPTELGGDRKYTVDFELYDARNNHFEKNGIEIYIALKE